jgi:hypothetical protein
MTGQMNICGDVDTALTGGVERRPSLAPEGS